MDTEPIIQISAGTACSLKGERTQMLNLSAHYAAVLVFLGDSGIKIHVIQNLQQTKAGEFRYG